MFLANENITVVEGALFSVVAMLIVFAVLAILVICVSLMAKIKFKEAKKEEEKKNEN